MTPVCPFVKASRPDDAGSPRKSGEGAYDKRGPEVKKDATVAAKCPFGYDAQTFKVGPLSCVICQALLFETAKCVPCSHVYCKACVSRFKHCPLCGVDIEGTEADTHLQSVVDRFIEGHARIKRSHVDAEDGEEAAEENKKCIYEDVSMERGAFLVQHAMRAFRAQNLDSAKSRLTLCAEDIRGQIERMGNVSELCSQLGAVLGMLGDCCRVMGDAGAAITYFDESVELLSKLPMDDSEVTHTLSVSLNKVGDLKYYEEDLQAARSYYFHSLSVRQKAMEHHPNVSSQCLDVATSLAKVADVDRNLGNEDAAIDGFRDAIKLLEALKLKPEEAALEDRHRSVLEFLNNQLAGGQPDSSLH